MRKSLSGALAGALALTLSLALGACGGQQQTQESGSAKPEVSDTKAAEYETSEYEGTLLTAYDSQLVLAGESGDMEFVTDDNTAYDTGDMGQMYLDDIVAVTYHEENGANHADKVVLVEHMETPLEFAGELVDVTKNSLTLASNKLSVTFQIDNDSYIVGELSKGDKVELTYLGDISEYPYADVVAVVEEAQEAKTSVIHGMVSELSGRTVLLSIDSAHAYRFVVTENTEIVGAAKDIAVGDQVDVTYQGAIDKQPDALRVNVVKRSDGRAYVINGTVAEVGNNSVTLDTGAAKYTFAAGSATKYYGEKPAKGYSAEITYTGNLADKPEARSVYCVKNAQEANKATLKKQAEAQKNASKASDKKEDAKVSDETSDKKDEKKEDASISDNTSESEGKKKSDEGSQTGTVNPDEIPDEEMGDTFEPTTPEESKQEGVVDGGQEAQTEVTEPEEPAAEPEQELEAEPEEEELGDEAPTEPAAEPEQEPATEPEEEPAAEPEQEPEVNAEPEVEQEPEAEQEEEPKVEAAKPDPDMGVSGQGTIVKYDEKKKTVDIKLKNDETITLTYNDDTKVSVGYIPQVGDVVKVEYGSTSKLLKDIQLIKREEMDADKDADAEAPAAETPAAEGEGAEGEESEG